MDEISRFFHKIGREIKKDSPIIFTVLSITTTIGAVVLTAIQTVKANDAKKEAEKEKGEELTAKEVVLLEAPYYILPATVCALAVASTTLSTVISKKQQREIIGCALLAKESYKKFIDTSLAHPELTRPREIEQQIIKEGNPNPPHNGKKLFYLEYYDDGCHEGYFESDELTVLEAFHIMNRRLSVEGYFTVNDLLDELGLKKRPSGDKLGWTYESLCDWYGDPWVDYNLPKIELDNGLECTEIAILQPPIFDYEFDNQY